jgi:hypothetical protein
MREKDLSVNQRHNTSIPKNSNIEFTVLRNLLTAINWQHSTYLHCRVSIPRNLGFVRMRVLSAGNGGLSSAKTPLARSKR